MKIPENVILLDSLGDIPASNTSPILVCGSHCGGNRGLAKQVKKGHVKAVFLNNAGLGKNNAGTRGLTHYEAENILACAVSHNSAEIGIASDTWENGIISHANTQAEAAGIHIGDSVKVAVGKLANSMTSPSAITENETPHPSLENKPQENKKETKKQIQTSIEGVSITVTDSITFLNESNAGDIVVCGSHGGASAGHYAQKRQVRAVFFNDAGIGKNNAGTKSLDPLSDAGIIACTVDCMSAEIFNGQDVLQNGIISVCNQLAKAKSIKVGMMVKDAIKHI